MSGTLRDLWPEDIRAEDSASPEEILDHQSQRLFERTNGLLIGEVVTMPTDDRVVLGFEISAPRIATRVRLFDVQHRGDQEYPAVILPPKDDLPQFLKQKYYVPSMREVYSGGDDEFTTDTGYWIENKWVASSAKEFSEKVHEVLALPSVKAAVMSLLSRVSRKRGNGSPSAPDISAARDETVSTAG